MTTTPKLAPSADAVIERCAQHLETIATRDSNGHRADYFRAAAVDIRSLATIPAAELVAVKPLEWSREPPYHVARTGPIMGSPFIEHYDGLAFPFKLTRPPVGTTFHETLAEAKAAAQADYEQRIRSALVASPQPARETDLLERLEYALTKDSLCKAEKIDSALHIVQAALRAGEQP